MDLFKSDRQNIKGIENWILKCTIVSECLKLRWGDSVDQDIGLIGEMKWTNLVVNRKKLKESQGPHRAVGPVMKMMMNRYI
jgi:hypothetical protein